MSDLTHDTWNAPPIPKHGDFDDNNTYAGVGRVLSAWEAAEAELSHIYAAFVGKYHQPEAYREYGAGRIFADRLAILKTAAAVYFVGHPNQDREGRFDQLVEIAEKFAARRNEVAHSIVRGVGAVRPFRAGDRLGEHFFLVPSHYNFKRFGPDHWPSYAYTSVELAYLNNGLWIFRGYLAVLRDELRGLG